MIETKEAVSVRKLQFLCLLITGIMELLMIVIGTSYQKPILYYLVVPCVVFLGATLMTDQCKMARKPLIMGAGMVVWFLVSRELQYLAGESPSDSTVSWAAYLMALPFAAALHDGEDQKGLDLFAACMILASVILSLLGMLLWADILPSSLEHLVYWDGARLHVNWHPNNTGSVFLIGTALTVRFFFRLHTWQGKGIMVLLAALQFTALVLTNSRTSLLIMCVFLAAAVFFCIGFQNRKRAVAALLAALLAVVGIFGASRVLFNRHNEARVADYAAELKENGEIASDVPDSQVTLHTEAGQGSLQNDMHTFNGRTHIWRAAYHGILQNPRILLRGTSDIIGTLLDGGCPFGPAHSHNSWIESVLGFGIPGLLMALFFTILAIFDTVFLLCNGKSDPSQNCTAMLTICLMGSGFLEPFLFVGNIDSQYCNIVFFLCLGYMEQWRKELRSKA